MTAPISISRMYHLPVLLNNHVSAAKPRTLITLFTWPIFLLESRYTAPRIASIVPARVLGPVQPLWDGLAWMYCVTPARLHLSARKLLLTICWTVESIAPSH